VKSFFCRSASRRGQHRAFHIPFKSYTTVSRTPLPIHHSLLPSTKQEPQTIHTVGEPYTSNTVHPQLLQAQCGLIMSSINAARRQLFLRCRASCTILMIAFADFGILSMVHVHRCSSSFEMLYGHEKHVEITFGKMIRCH